jgi:hypothetical protein
LESRKTTESGIPSKGLLENPQATVERAVFLERGYSKQSDDDPIFKKSSLEMV